MKYTSEAAREAALKATFEAMRAIEALQIPPFSMLRPEPAMSESAKRAAQEARINWEFER